MTINGSLWNISTSLFGLFLFRDASLCLPALWAGGETLLFQSQWLWLAVRERAEKN